MSSSKRAWLLKWLGESPRFSSFKKSNWIQTFILLLSFAKLKNKQRDAHSIYKQTKYFQDIRGKGVGATQSNYEFSHSLILSKQKGTILDETATPREAAKNVASYETLRAREKQETRWW